MYCVWMRVPVLEGLTLTEVIEIPVYCAAFVYILGKNFKVSILVASAVNLLSYPLFVFVLDPAVQRLVPVEPALWASEIMVWLFEAGALYAWVRRELAVITTAALLANACSFLVGFLLL